MIAGVVLAAGASTRLGRPKQLVRYGGASLIRRAVQAAQDGSCDPVIVVVGAGASAIEKELAGLTVDVVHNAGWPEGIASSIRRAIEFVDPRPIRAVLFLTCDQWKLTADVVRRVCDRFDGRERCRVACSYAGTLGVPALFERAWFPELLKLSGDRGARSLLNRPPHTVHRVPWPEATRDLDERGQQP